MLCLSMLNQIVFFCWTGHWRCDELIQSKNRKRTHHEKHTTKICSNLDESKGFGRIHVVTWSFSYLYETRTGVLYQGCSWERTQQPFAADFAQTKNIDYWRVYFSSFSHISIYFLQINNVVFIATGRKKSWLEIWERTIWAQAIFRVWEYWVIHWSFLITLKHTHTHTYIYIYEDRLKSSLADHDTSWSVAKLGLFFFNLVLLLIHIPLPSVLQWLDFIGDEAFIFLVR